MALYNPWVPVPQKQGRLKVHKFLAKTRPGLDTPDIFKKSEDLENTPLLNLVAAVSMRDHKVLTFEHLRTARIPEVNF